MPVIIMERSANTNLYRQQHTQAGPKIGWKADLAGSFTRIENLLGYLGLPPGAGLGGGEPARRFPFQVTAAFASRMKPGDPNDPLLLQVLPLAEEMRERAGYSGDPVGDLPSVVVPGLLHKYHGRALLIATGTCAINCRYCFRREFPYAEGQLTRSRYAEAFSHIAADASITEVILSGGDPLVLDDGHLADLVEAIAAMPQVKRLRIHTRVPIVLPSRIGSELTQIISGTRLKCIIVIHVNHANELDAEVSQALLVLRKAGAVLLNQSVLLKGVNDTVDALASLSEALIEYGVAPYYLHLLDKAKGTGHFEVDETTALELHDSLRRRLPGYLVPKLVRETASKPYKESLA